ncbi:TMEM165/GDT1 family protein [Sphingobium subterraneum]|uniref:GDT1 family protein n=1 Tax=Sphingobium subterraneum TaxID=627688 RepID=A0A841J604_9SPHN|nr:TMEM165/GDT1 family protein [Sphingobium subterraneum]MBB6124946.1 putative Ca2+/H+ antiporter (TMEM165/GDT1 family) [Sphingobium subterraneum]
MDTLLLTLLACLWGETGDRSQMLTAAFARRWPGRLTVILGLVVAAAANAALSAWAGSFIATSIGVGARGLFLALALLAASVAMLMPVKTPDLLVRWRVGAFGTSALGLFILGFGESAQFLIAGMATARAEPSWAAVGGATGVILACLLPLICGPDIFSRLPLRMVRRTGAAIFFLIGSAMALAALGLL